MRRMVRTTSAAAAPLEGMHRGSFGRGRRARSRAAARHNEDIGCGDTVMVTRAVQQNAVVLTGHAKDIELLVTASGSEVGVVAI